MLTAIDATFRDLFVQTESVFRRLSRESKIALGVGGLIVAAVLLRKSTPIQRAESEWKKWSGFDENDPRALPLLAQYWAAVGLSPQPTSVAWSAAFISAVAAGFLKPSADHIGYTRAAWRDRQNQIKGRYWAYQPNEVLPLQKGDIVVKGRGSELASWYDVTSNTGHKDTHGDLVTDTKNGLTLIGGNVSNSVSKTQIDSLPHTVFAVLRKA